MNNSKESEKSLLTVQSIKAIVTPKDVENLIYRHYGLQIVKIEELNGYDDINFLIEVNNTKENDNVDRLCDDGYVFKVINSLDSEKLNFFEAQDAALIHLTEQNVCCPKPIRTKQGETFFVEKLLSGVHVMRLLEFIPGKILSQTEATLLLYYETGQTVANLHNRLVDFSHQGYKDRNTPWMLDNLPQLKNFLFAVKDEKRRNLVSQIIERFESEVLPESLTFHRGLIHGDMNEENILVERRGEEWHVKGILDFGDMHVACLFYDVAITMAYLIIEARNIDYGGYVLAGYTSTRHMTQHEKSLLKICVCARFCQSLVMGAFTISRDPRNTYVTKTSIAGWHLLEELWNIPDEEILERWLQVCTKKEV